MKKLLNWTFTIYILFFTQNSFSNQEIIESCENEEIPSGYVVTSRREAIECGVKRNNGRGQKTFYSKQTLTQLGAQTMDICDGTPQINLFDSSYVVTKILSPHNCGIRSKIGGVSKGHSRIKIEKLGGERLLICDGADLIIGINRVPPKGYKKTGVIGSPYCGAKVNNILFNHAVVEKK